MFGPTRPQFEGIHIRIWINMDPWLELGPQLITLVPPVGSKWLFLFRPYLGKKHTNPQYYIESVWDNHWAPDHPCNKSCLEPLQTSGYIHSSHQFFCFSRLITARGVLFATMEKQLRPFSGWLFGTCFIFSIIFWIIIPTDFHIFQRGRSTTNQ